MDKSASHCCNIPRYYLCLVLNQFLIHCILDKLRTEFILIVTTIRNNLYMLGKTLF